MKISVITVSLNNEKTVAQTIDSVLMQSHDDVEYIFIDGGSTDSTMDIVNSKLNNEFKIISEKDFGIYNAMNKGLAIANGDIIGFLNADDQFYDSNVLSRINSALIDSSANLIYGNLILTNFDTTKTLRYWNAGSFSPLQIRLGWMPPHPTTYVTKCFFNSVGGFREDLKISSDYDFLLRCLTNPNVKPVWIDHPQVLMRAGGASNKSIKSIAIKLKEDFCVVKQYPLLGWMTVLAKNLRKISQFFNKPPH